MEPANDCIRVTSPASSEQLAGRRKAPPAGWVSVGLTGADIRDMTHAWHVAEKSARLLNYFLTRSPPRDMPDEDRRRESATFRGHVAQKLHRNGYPCIAIFVREKKFEDEAEAGEHLHSPIYLPDRKSIELVREFEYVDVRKNDGRDGAFKRLLYAQKQRTAQAEGYRKAKLPRQPFWHWEKPAPLIGQRWSVTKDLEALVTADATKIGVRRYVTAVPLEPLGRPLTIEPLAPIESGGALLFGFVADDLGLGKKPRQIGPPARGGRSDHLIEEPQLELSLAAEVVDIRPLLETKRLRDGLSQVEAAQRLGVGQGHYSNCVVRLHDHLSSWSRNRALEWLAQDRAA